MKKDELEKKIRSFSELSGLGKKFSHYTLIDTAQDSFIPSTAGRQLPSSLTVKFSAGKRTEILFAILLVSIALLASAALENSGARIAARWYVPGSVVVLFLFGLDVIKRAEKKSTMVLFIDDQEVRFNRDRFKHAEVERFLLKTDHKISGTMVAFWFIIVKKNMDIYYYELPLRYYKRKMYGEHKLEDLLHHFRTPFDMPLLN